MTTNDNQDEAKTVADSKTLTVRGETTGGVLVASVSGRVDGSNAHEFQEALETLIAGGESVLVLDLEQLGYISSAGLRVILLVSRQIQSRGGKFGVSSLMGSIKEVFTLSGFDRIIPSHNTVSDAVAALGK